MANMEDMVSQIVEDRINQHHATLVRRMGGLPVNRHGFVMEKGAIEVGLLAEQPDFDKPLMDATFDLLAAYNAMELSDEQKAKMVLYFTLLTSSRPLSPLTGDKREWVQSGDKEVNVRDPRIVRKNGKSYFIQAFAFEREGKKVFDGEKSWSEVSFPLNISELKTEVKKV